MEKFLSKTKQVILTKQGGIISSALILSFMLIISRTFGFLRYRILAGFFAKEELDIFFASFRIPDLVFEILITGALTSSFIPIFIKYQKHKDDLNKNISSIINLITLFLLLFMVLLFFALPFLIPFITPGFSAEKNSQIIAYSRILLVTQLPFLVLGNFLTGIGQANKTFVLTAIAPIFYNLAIIASTMIFSSTLALLAPILGVAIGSVLFFMAQIPLLFSSEFQYLFTLRATKGLKDFFSMVVPRVLTTTVAQIDATIDLTLATLLGAGSYTIFYLAQHLQLLPVSVIGIAFGQASLPYLSEMYQEKKIEELQKVVSSSLVNLFFLTVPIMSFFVFARTPLVRLFFGGQKFDWDATVLTAITLSYFSLSLPFHSVYYFITRCFYALLDTKTPFLLGCISILVNTALSIYFILFLKLPVWSLGISFSVSITLNVIFLTYILAKKLGGLDFFFMFEELIKISIAAFGSSFISYYVSKILDGLVFDTTRTINVFFLVLVAGLVFGTLYLLFSWFLNVQEMYLFTRVLMKLKEYHRKIVTLYYSPYES